MASRDAMTKRRAGGRRSSFRQPSIPIAQLTHLREGAYRLLSQSLLYPTEETTSRARNLLLDLTDNDSIWEEFAFWNQLIELKAIWEQRLQILQNRYVALFMTATGGVPCPPYESAYLASNAGDTGLQLAAIERDYATAGLHCSPTQKLSPDHVSLELEFMAILCGQESEAWESGNARRGVRQLKKQRRFLDAHLGSWLPAFVRDVTSADVDGVYSTIGAATLAFVTHDRDLCEELAYAMSSDQESDG